MYLPLSEFIIDFITSNTFSSEELSIVNPRYCMLFHQTYITQKMIGWEHFSRGYITLKWKRIQYLHLLEIKTEDIHAVDIWARMVIRSLLEIHSG